MTKNVEPNKNKSRFMIQTAEYQAQREQHKSNQEAKTGYLPK